MLFALDILYSNREYVLSGGPSMEWVHEGVKYFNSIYSNIYITVKMQFHGVFLWAYHIYSKQTQSLEKSWIRWNMKIKNNVLTTIK